MNTSSQGYGVPTTTIEELVVDKLKDRKSLVVERAAPSPQDRDLHTSLFTEHVTGNLDRQVDEMRSVEGAFVTPDTLHEARTFGGLGSEARMYAHLTERLDVALSKPMQTLNYTIAGGTWVLGPPYDEEWQTGSGLAFGARLDGSPITISGDGYSAAGVGFYVSSPDTLLAAVTPQGSYDYNWFSVDAMPGLHSRGGMGITVYLNGNPQPVASRQAVLWNVKGVNAWSGDQGSGRIADAASPAWGFGPVPIAPVYVNTAPGLNYLIWVWCWQIKQFAPPSGGGFLAFMRFTMPFVTVNAGPPIIIK